MRERMAGRFDEIIDYKSMYDPILIEYPIIYEYDIKINCGYPYHNRGNSDCKY